MKMKTTLLLLIFTTFKLFALDFELITNEPGLQGGQSMVIEERFLELLEQTPAGESVHLNIYGLKLPHIASAIVAAKNRGVEIHIIMRPFRDDKSNESMEILRPAFEKKSESSLKVCGLMCSAVAFNHNKFMLFSKLNDGSENIVIHTSNNFWDEERNNYNDFLIIKNNKNLYDHLKKYFKHIRKGFWGNWYRSFSKVVDESVSVFTFPSKEKGEKVENYMLQVFESISCKKGGKIYLAHSRFTDARIKAAEMLKNLSDSGCDVKVFLKNDIATDSINLPLGIKIPVIKDSPGEKVKSVLGELLTVFPYEEPINGKPWQEGDPKRNALHSQIMLIEIPGENDISVKKVFIGTHNFDGPSLNLNNELLLEIQDKELFDQYMDSFLRLENDYISLYGSGI